MLNEKENNERNFNIKNFWVWNIKISPNIIINRKRNLNKK